MQYPIELKSLWLACFATIALLITSCAPNQGTASSTNKVTARVFSAGDTAGSTTSSGSSALTSTQPIVNNSASPLEFTVSGMGNHPQAVCIPAKTKLVLRIIPHANYAPLMSYNPYLLSMKNNLPLYDGSPAYYNKLRVRLSIPGSTASWDFNANLESNSVSADFTSAMRSVAATNVPSSSMLSTPEYDVSKTIWGSNPSDGLCTYWEQQLGRCQAVSGILRTAETTTCASGQQKIMITNIVSDYPCTNDATVGWCQGGSMQTVPDYQQWSLTLQAATESTMNLH